MSDRSRNKAETALRYAFCFMTGPHFASSATFYISNKIKSPYKSMETKY